MAVPNALTASMGAAAFVVAVLVATPEAVAQHVCKSVDKRGNVTYRDCPPPTTYSPEPARPAPTVEEERPPAPAAEVIKPSEPKPREPARSFPWTSRSAASPAGPRQTYPIVGVPLLLGGMLVALVASIGYLVAAFRVGLWWGLGCLFVSPVSLLFLILHWKVARKPFFISLAGVAAAFVGYFVLGAGT